MKTKLLRRLRREGRNAINVTRITRRGDLIVGMGYCFDDDDYRGLFELGDTEEEVREKAMKIYIQKYLNRERGA